MTMVTRVRKTTIEMVKPVAEYLRGVLKMHHTQIDGRMRGSLDWVVRTLAPGINYQTVSQLRAFVLDESCAAAAQGHTDLADSLDVAYGTFATILAKLDI
jgi:hypothetical protein